MPGDSGDSDRAPIHDPLGIGKTFFSGHRASNLPKPTAVYPANDLIAAAGWTEGMVLGMLTNPAYVGFGPYPRIVDDERWIGAAKAMIERDGVEQFLVNMLHMLRSNYYPGDDCEIEVDDGE